MRFQAWSPARDVLHLRCRRAWVCPSPGRWLRHRPRAWGPSVP
jgi:hypothetical protein